MPINYCAKKISALAENTPSNPKIDKRRNKILKITI